MRENYTPEQMKDSKRIFEILARVPSEKRYLVTIATEAFINGMVAQEHLAANIKS